MLILYKSGEQRWREQSDSRRSAEEAQNDGDTHLLQSGGSPCFLWVALLGRTHFFLLRSAQPWAGVLPAWTPDFSPQPNPGFAVLYRHIPHCLLMCYKAWFPLLKHLRLKPVALRSSGPSLMVVCLQNGCCSSRHCIQASCFPDTEVQAQHLTF